MPSLNKNFYISQSYNINSNYTIEIESLMVDMNTSFVATYGIIVFAMMIGFAFLEAGVERSKNVTNMLIKVVSCALVVAMTFWGSGYAFGFGDRADEEQTNGFCGTRGFFMSEKIESLPEEAVWFFQWTFASCSAAIVSGAIAGRASFQSFLVFAGFYSAWIYPVVAHWMWSPFGWLHPGSIHNPFSIGVVDFAGGSVVHTVGGVAALFGAMIIGPRHNRFTSAWDGPRAGILSSSKSFWTTLGVFLLWFGWYAFNMGSSGKITGGFSHLIGAIAMNNTLASAGGAAGPLIIHKIWKKNWDINITLNGILAGLASITAGCAFIYPWSAFVTGAIGGLIYYGIATLMFKIQIDDPLDAVAIHLGAGGWGLISAGLFSIESRIVAVYDISGHYGLIMGGGGYLLGIQMLGLLCAVTWSAVWCGSFFFFVMHKLKLLRVPLDIERLGLDVAHLQMTQQQLKLFKRKTVALDNVTTKEARMSGDGTLNGTFFNSSSPTNTRTPNSKDTVSE